jgi:hypothetical protein
MAAGLPLILQDNSDHIVASNDKVRELEIGLFYKDINHLVSLLKAKGKLEILEEKVKVSRHLFHFDNYVPELISFFHEVIKNNNEKITGNS